MFFDKTNSLTDILKT